MSLLLADGDARNILVTLWSANSSSTLIKALYTFQEQTFHKAYQIDLAGWYWCWAGLNLCSHLYLFIALIVLLRSFVQASQGGIRKRLRLFVFASRSRCTYDLELSRRMLIQLCGQVYPSQIYALPRVQRSLRAHNLSAALTAFYWRMLVAYISGLRTSRQELATQSRKIIPFS
jgi:hypothetical protein